MTDADYVMDFFEWVYANAYPSTGHFLTDSWLHDTCPLNVNTFRCEVTLGAYLRERAELADLLRITNYRDAKRAKIPTVQIRHAIAVRYIVLMILRQYMSLEPVLTKHREAIIRMVADRVTVLHFLDAIISEVIEQKEKVETDAIICRLTEKEEQNVREGIGRRIRDFTIYLSDERDGHLADLMPRFAAETILSALRCGVIRPEDLVEHTPQNEFSVAF